MPDAIITSTESTFGTISGTFAADQSTISGTILGPVAGSLSGSVGVPGPAGVGIPAGGLEGQIIVKASETDYDTVWADNSAETLTATVRNETGATLTKGTVVYINGASGNKATVTKASASTESGSSKTFAILKDDILNNQNGTAVTVGLLKGVDTSAFSPGANLWLSTTAGQITQTMPTSPNHAVFLGNAVRIHANQGEIEVRIQNGLELGELHDVLIHDVANGQVLKYDSAQGLWVNGTDSAGVAWGGITGTLSDQTDLQTALDGKYSTSNPAGYITSSALTGYATESFVTSQGYITSAALSPYLLSSTAASTYQTIAGMSSYLTTSAAASTYYPLTNPSGYITSSALAGYATESWVTSELSSYLTTADAVTTYYPLVGNPSAFVNTTDIADMATQTWVTAGFYPLSSNPAGYLTSASLSGYATESWVTGQLGSYLTTSAAASTYAALAGATFTGVVGFNGASGNVAAKSTGYFKAYTSGLESTDFSLQYDTGFQVVVGGSTVARIAASGILAPSSGITFSDATTQTTAGVSAATVAATYAPLASPALTGNPTAPTPATADNDTSIATTAFVKAQGYLTSAPVTSVAGKTGAVTLVVGDVSGAAPLASPTFTGTPAAPTASAGTSTTQLATTAFVTTADNLKANLASPTFTGVPAAPTATAGTNTTQIATTAFVQQEVPAASTTAAGKVELATFVESTRFNSQTIAATPASLLGLITANGCPIRPRSSAFTSASSGAGASAASYYGATICYGPSASTVGYGGVYFDAAGFWASNNAYTTPDWSKVTGFSVMAYRPSIGFVNGNTIRITLGKASSGGTLSTRGIGVDIAAANTYAKILAHNGTTLTTTDSTFLVSSYANLSTRNITMVSYGNGTVELFVNGVSYGTSSGGPTTAGGTGTRYSEEVYGDGTQSAAMQLWTFNASVFTGL